MTDAEEPHEDSATPALTWAALLARWTTFARASVAAGDTQWRLSVAPIIALQAVAHALEEIDQIEPDERALGLDKAEILIADNTKALHQAWAGRDMPQSVIDVAEDARRALAGAIHGGVELILEDDALVASHPGELVGALIAGGFDGDLLLPAPGRRLFRSCPVAFIRPVRGGLVSDAILEFIASFLDAELSGQSTPEPRQVYRQFDFAASRAVRDLVSPMSADLAPGQPLLVWAIEKGESTPVALPPKGVDDIEHLPVEFAPTGF